MLQSKAEKAKVSSLVVPADYSLDKADSGITQSLLGSYQNCPRKFLFIINRWEKPGSGRGYAYGSMMHEALDGIYTAAANGSTKPDDLIGIGMKAIDVFKLPPVFKPEEAEVLKACGEAVIQNYIPHYKVDFIQNRFEVPERVFNVKWRGIVLRGKIDGGFRDKHKGLWHMEHKNYSKINEDNMQKKLSFDLQNLFYLLSGKMETGAQVKGVLYNVLRRPDVRKELPIGKVRDYVSNLIKGNPGHYFFRWEIPYTTKDLAIFEAELWNKLSRLHGDIAQARGGEPATNVFWKNEFACESTWPCQFLDACSSGSMAGYVKKKSLYAELAPTTAKDNV